MNLHTGGHRLVCLIKLFSFSNLEGNFGGNQRPDGSISLYPSPSLPSSSLHHHNHNNTERQRKRREKETQLFSSLLHHLPGADMYVALALKITVYIYTHTFSFTFSYTYTCRCLFFAHF